LTRSRMRSGRSELLTSTVEQERLLAEVLAPMLETPDMWRSFADAYLAELDRIAAAEAPPPGKKNRTIRRDWTDSFWDRDYKKSRRTGNLAPWNSLLLEHLDTGRAQRLAGHAAFSGPEADFLKAQAARPRGDLDEARTLITECLMHLPGSTEFAAFAEKVGAAVPS